MATTVTRRYHFEAGHWLPKVADEHKCKRPHGHNYILDVTVGGQVRDNGFIIDFWDLDKIVNPIIATVDHRMLNDVTGLENPTAENIAYWFLAQLSNCSVIGVRVYETRDCWADCTI